MINPLECRLLTAGILEKKYVFWHCFGILLSKTHPKICFKWIAIITNGIYFSYLILATQANLQGVGEGQEEKDKGRTNRSKVSNKILNKDYYRKLPKMKLN